MRTIATQFGTACRRAFTLVELLIVVSIIAIGVTLMVPAFGEVLRSINYSGAINQVTAALGNARAQAIRTGRHAGVVFRFDIEKESCSLQVVELLQPGALTEFGTAPLDETIGVALRASSGEVPVTLPKGTAVVGLSFKVADMDDVVDTAGASDTASWYAGQSQNPEDDDPRTHVPLWLFPQNDPRLYTNNNPPTTRFWGVDPWEVLAGRAPNGANVSTKEAEAAVRHSQSFMVLFSPSGSVVSEIEAGATIMKNAWLEFAEGPIPRGMPTGKAYDWRDRFDPQNLGPNLGGFSESDADVPASRSEVSPNPEIFLRAADQLAVIDLGLLTRDTGIARPWLVRPEESDRKPIPSWVIAQTGRSKSGAQISYIQPDSDSTTNPPLHRIVSRWIDDNAEILSFSRYTGDIIRRAAP